MNRYINQLRAFDRRNRQIARLFAKGVKKSEIARRFKISRQRVGQVLAK